MATNYDKLLEIIRGGGRNGLQMVQDVCEKVTG